MRLRCLYVHICMFIRKKNEKKTIGKQTSSLIENNCIKISYKYVKKVQQYQQQLDQIKEQIGVFFYSE